MGSEIAHGSVRDEMSRPEPLDCQCGIRKGRFVCVCSSGWGGYVATSCTVCLFTDVHAYAVEGWWDGTAWRRDDLLRGLITASLEERDGFSARARVPASVEEALAQIAQYNQDSPVPQSDDNLWSAWLRRNRWRP